MNIAMLAIVLDPAGRSTNIARVLRLIDAAARSEPAPDLIVVPSGCDEPCGSQALFSPAMADVYGASLSSRAREWGVFVAFAHRGQAGRSDHNTAVLLDADGDECLVNNAGDALPTVASGRTIIGSVGLCFESPSLAAVAWRRTDSPAPSVIVVFGRRLEATGSVLDDGDICRCLAERSKAFVLLIRASAVGAATSGSIVCSDSSLLREPLKEAAGCVCTAVVPRTVPADSSA